VPHSFVRPCVLLCGVVRGVWCCMWYGRTTTKQEARESMGVHARTERRLALVLAGRSNLLISVITRPSTDMRLHFQQEQGR